ncbi:hypothetical protein PVAP13_9NG387000 [Panicum virgatum]|uniref:Topo IIA-type catalytic domain-containing protein n=1 Tax=Panicum virgatum TaxID=38727 RepID=A0A8T0MQ19_PANVG|nr:hypothetical protein PVAP13_9NG387000 [Panicum virgatum]KAG2538592.1 hypothetical protein PVAP13_9NG387000 [Panicum virgatum]KAG2538593.1 hypothetical protein PVAP13_9NG387000 [Panicum virgatum]KAG2538594.1 hypothetical protein PVAP13_9NG387000 [Panicum virgatum]
MRYTECRLDSLAEAMFLTDLELNTVSLFTSLMSFSKEPSLLPTRVSSLLLNGYSGIAVGMATNIPHNLGELVDALSVIIQNPEATGFAFSKHVQNLRVSSAKKTIMRTRKWRLEIWRETTLRQITRDVAESCNPQTWHPLTPRRHPPSVRLLCIRHRGQVRRLQGRCYKFPLLFSPLVILRAILLSVSLTILYQQGEETSSGLKQYCRIDRDLYYLALSIPSVKIQSFFLLNC